MDIFEAINNRRSVRTFSRAMPPADVMAELKEYLAKHNTDHYRIEIIDSNLSGGVGSYGVISNAPAWLALITDGSARSTLRCAMLAEEVVLRLTARGVATCWIGGTFNSGSVAKLINPGPGERIAAVVPLGIAAAKKRLLERLQSSLIHSRRRKPFDTLFNIAAGVPGDFRKILETVRQAPSAVNAQPWRINVDADGVATFRSATDNSYTMLDMGIALAHFTLAAEALGIDGRLEIPSEPAPGFIARWTPEAHVC